jgi:hypothetical protein
MNLQNLQIGAKALTSVQTPEQSQVTHGHWAAFSVVFS